MEFRAKFTDGNLTVGEANVSVGLVTGTNPDAIEGFVVIAYVHTENGHALLISSNVDRGPLDALLYLAHRTTMDGTYAIPTEIDIHSNFLRSARLWFGRRYLWH